jgi:single-stranded-DNA-specific exonuclease
LPEAAAVVHPRLPGAGYPFGGLSGSGVAFKLAWSLCQAASGAKKVGQRMKEFLLQAVGLAALGTVADVVPLLDENRVLVRHGLVSLAQRPTLGMATLMDVAQIDRSRPLSAEDIAFQLAPRLNAAGRLGQPRLAVELLVTDRADRAAELAQYIDQLNAQRQTLERSIYLAAGKQIKQSGEEAPALVLADREWHAGVIGIVAGRLAEKHGRPVVLISWDQLGVKPGIGSARSVPGFNLHAALQSCARHLVAHGGHAAAAGLRIEEASLEPFRADFCEYVATELDPQACVTELLIDAEAPFSAFTMKAVEQIEQLAPFGEGNARPVLCTNGATLVEPPRAIGGGGRHLSLRLSQHGVTFRAVAFGGSERAEELSAGGCLDVAFRPVINHYRGRHNVELQLVDWQPATQA